VPSSPAWRNYLTIARLWDVLAVIAIGFALWKIFLAPRRFEASRTHRAPHAVFARLGGGTFHLADQRGHVVFLDFYASWCEPCKIELPLVEGWARAHRSAVVVPVDVGEPAATVRAFARRFRIENVAVDPTSNSSALFSIVGFPTVVVVDADGFERAKWEGLNPAIALAMSNAERSL